MQLGGAGGKGSPAATHFHLPLLEGRQFYKLGYRGYIRGYIGIIEGVI